MHVSALSPWLLRLVMLGAGLLAGAGAARLADVLPPRYGITHLVTGKPRARRNAALVVLAAVMALGIAELALARPSRGLTQAAAEMATSLVLGAVLLAGAAIDLEHMILPDEITFGGAFLGIATSYFRGLGLVSSLVGAVAGFAVTYLPFVIYKRVRGKSGMGLGDAKLLVMLGAWLGWQGALFAMFAGAVQSTLTAVVMRIVGVTYDMPASVAAEIEEMRQQAAEGDAEAQAALDDDPMAAEAGEGLLATRMPLGPFLALGAFEALYAQRWVAGIFDWILSG